MKKKKGDKNLVTLPLYAILRIVDDQWKKRKPISRIVPSIGRQK